MHASKNGQQEWPKTFGLHLRGTPEATGQNSNGTYGPKLYDAKSIPYGTPFINSTTL